MNMVVVKMGSEDDGYVILIRHGEKQWANSDRKNKPYFDPGITADGEYYIEDQVNLLIDKYGEPDRIIVSPYLRTRLTADIITTKCITTDRNIKVEIDRDFGEYLGHQHIGKNGNMEDFFSAITHEHSPHLGEDVISFRDRCRRAYNNKICTREKNEKIIIVTHGFTMEQLIKIHTKKSVLKGAASHIRSTGLYKLI